MASKQALIDQVAKKGVLTKAEAERSVDLVFDSMKLVVGAQGELKIVGMLTLTKVNKPATTARNPRTGDAVAVPAKTVVKAKVSPSFLK